MYMKYRMFPSLSCNILHKIEIKISRLNVAFIDKFKNVRFHLNRLNWSWERIDDILYVYIEIIHVLLLRFSLQIMEMKTIKND